MPVHKRFKPAGYYSKAARAARSVAFRERMAMRASRNLFSAPKRKYSRSGKFSKAAKASRKQYKYVGSVKNLFS
jgi:hypothetical protein